MPVVPHAGSIIVGLDGSKHAEDALRWAADEARRREAPLHLVHAVDLDWLVAAAAISDVSANPSTDEVLGAACSRLSMEFPDLRVTAQVTTGSPAHDLVKLSFGARELVVGGHGTSPSHVPLGSVPSALASHAACPVVVVRPYAEQGQSSRPVVVGVDGSEVSARAIDFAMDHASRLGTPLVVLHAWWLEFVDGVIVTTVNSPEWLRARERIDLTVAESLAGRRERYPEVEVLTRTVSARPAAALIEASRDASLVVVGSRGRGGFAGLLLGSVSREVLMQAAAPVAVVRPT
jgi:nucleotide-binding universal stress UspA family protein